MITAHRRLSLALAVCIASASLVAAQPALAGSKESEASQTAAQTSNVEQQIEDYMDKVLKPIMTLLKQLAEQRTAGGSIKRG